MNVKNVNAVCAVVNVVCLGIVIWNFSEMRANNAKIQANFDLIDRNQETINENNAKIQRNFEQVRQKFVELDNMERDNEEDLVKLFREDQFPKLIELLQRRGYIIKIPAKVWPQVIVPEQGNRLHWRKDPEE